MKTNVTKKRRIPKMRRLDTFESDGRAAACWRVRNRMWNVVEKGGLG